MKTALLAAFLLTGATPAAAQGVFDMGQLTGTLSQDAVTQSEEARADKESAAESRRKTRANCAKVSQLRKRYGPSDARIRWLTDTCRKLGHPTG
ncbi:hypothetical protein [Sphingosinicella sp. BN140058]|uniref:hypothetical protein n=1 Tax=Sphingosinicella sp. BN140058 TaxID=1892855 RepID=UPI001013B803|nr:hypothetical protein [Sphingosinicella sp. BN140058]QAY77242.1 hypothetical protein ETR14_12580 [Sphingosinicella sp. BN140058]